LIRTTLGNKFEFPWENYDKWPAKLKAEVQKLNSQIDKEREKQPAMFKKLMQARGTWR
jgi:predicted  nucleic acid-binding Zn-ribbon protein